MNKAKIILMIFIFSIKYHDLFPSMHQDLAKLPLWQYELALLGVSPNALDSSRTPLIDQPNYMLHSLSPVLHPHDSE